MPFSSNCKYVVVYPQIFCIVSLELSIGHLVAIKFWGYLSLHDIPWIWSLGLLDDSDFRKYNWRHDKLCYRIVGQPKMASKIRNQRRGHSVIWTAYSEIWLLACLFFLGAIYWRSTYRGAWFFPDFLEAGSSFSCIGKISSLSHPDPALFISSFRWE